MEKDKEDRTKARFPPPPTYYKQFSSPSAMSPPNYNFISKLNSFRTFGTEYKIKDVNNFFNPVEIQVLQRLPKEKVDEITISNLKFFQIVNASIQDQTQHYIKINLNFNLIKELETEIQFLKDRYKKLLSNFGKNFPNCEKHFLRTVTLPLWPDMMDEMVQKVIEVVIQTGKKYAN